MSSTTIPKSGIHRVIAQVEAMAAKTKTTSSMGNDKDDAVTTQQTQLQSQSPQVQQKQNKDKGNIAKKTSKFSKTQVKAFNQLAHAKISAFCSIMKLKYDPNAQNCKLLGAAVFLRLSEPERFISEKDFKLLSKGDQLARNVVAFDHLSDKKEIDTSIPGFIGGIAKDKQHQAVRDELARRERDARIIRRQRRSQINTPLTKATRDRSN